MRREIYGVGGYIASHPSGNKLEVWDDGPSTYTAYNAAGTVITSRALTAQEILDVNPPASQIPALLTQAMAGLQGIIDAAPAVVTTLAQAQTAIRACQAAERLEAQVLRRLIRVQLQIFDAAG